MSSPTTPITSASAPAPAPAPDFSTPVYMEEPGPSQQASASSNHASVSSVSSVSSTGSEPDLNALEFQLESNVDVDAYAAPPPIPDGRYRVKLKQIDVKLADGSTGRYKIVQKPDKNNGQPYVFTAIEATVQDSTGKHDGLKVYDRFVSTMTARNGGIPIVRILTCLGHKLPAQVSPKVLIEKLLAALAPEPELDIETVWEGSLDEATRELFEQTNTKQPRILGMHRFPPAKDDQGRELPGKHSPDMDVEVSVGGETKKVHLHAQVRINGYHPAKR